jgi:hypothetical protein
MTATKTTGVKTTEVKMPTIPFNQLTPMTEKECKEAGLPHTSKAKARMGVNDHHEIVWVPANFAVEDHANLMAFAKAKGITAYEMLAAVAMQWFHDNRDAIYAEAEVSYRAEMTVDELMKKIAASERMLERSRAMLAKLSTDDEPATE